MASKKSSRHLKAYAYGAAMTLFVFFASISAAHAQKELSDEEFALCKSNIERAHQGFYKLSFSQEFVRDSIMSSIRAERVTVAPHFPERKAGQDADRLFRTWIEKYPSEYEQYLLFLRKQHEKWRIASTANR